LLWVARYMPETNGIALERMRSASAAN
jgi:hypothetical protein